MYFSAAATVHVGTGKLTLPSQEEHLILSSRISSEIMHASFGTLNMFEQFSFLSGSCLHPDLTTSGVLMRKKILCLHAQISAQSIGQVFLRNRSVLLIGHTLHTHV